MAPAHAGADRVPYIIEQVNIEIAAKEEETDIIVQVTIEITGDSNTLGGGIPRYIVGVRTRFFQATVEEHSWDGYIGTVSAVVVMWPYITFIVQCVIESLPG